jgi:hypothetical protein
MVGDLLHELVNRAGLQCGIGGPDNGVIPQSSPA